MRHAIAGKAAAIHHFAMTCCTGHGTDKGLVLSECPDMTSTIVDIRRYPVKGLSAEALPHVALNTGQGLPHDRRFAIARGEIDFDPKHPAWLRKTNFFMLMREASLARLKTGFDEETGVLTIALDGEVVAQSDVTAPDGRTEIERFLTGFLGDDAKNAAPRLLEAPGHMFGDASPKDGSHTDKYVSLIGMESLRALEKHVNGPVDLIRFRANFYLEGSTAWEEFQWVGQTLSAGEATLRVLSPITRCAATQVNPATAARDLNVPKALQQGFGHNNMGIYAEVVDGGVVAIGDGISPRR